MRGGGQGEELRPHFPGRVKQNLDPYAKEADSSAPIDRAKEGSETSAVRIEGWATSPVGSVLALWMWTALIDGWPTNLVLDSERPQQVNVSKESDL